MDEAKVVGFLSNGRLDRALLGMMLLVTALVGLNLWSVQSAQRNQGEAAHQNAEKIDETLKIRNMQSWVRKLKEQNPDLNVPTFHMTPRKRRSEP